MEEKIVCQGRSLSFEEVKELREWIADHPQWSRHRIGLELCRRWEWKTQTGMLKSFAARSFLYKMEQRSLISLPPIQEAMRRGSWSVLFDQKMDMVPEAIEMALSDLLPLSIVLCLRGSEEEKRFRSYLTTYHYLGFGRTVGENLLYLIQDRRGKDLSCVLFGSAAWKTAVRDTFIGWDPQSKARHLHLIANNTRFLIFPWVRVSHLASCILGNILRRLSLDWQKKYGHPIHLVETFVDTTRFKGTCYQAANWVCVGNTQGRSRQDRNHVLKVPIKAVYLYPLNPSFRKELCDSFG